MNNVENVVSFLMVLDQSGVILRLRGNDSISIVSGEC